jgi:hypothetical protein
MGALCAVQISGKCLMQRKTTGGLGRFSLKLIFGWLDIQAPKSSKTMVVIPQPCHADVLNV